MEPLTTENTVCGTFDLHDPEDSAALVDSGLQIDNGQGEQGASQEYFDCEQRNVNLQESESFSEFGRGNEIIFQIVQGTPDIQTYTEAANPNFIVLGSGEASGLSHQHEETDASALIGQSAQTTEPHGIVPALADSIESSTEALDLKGACGDSSQDGQSAVMIEVDENNDSVWKELWGMRRNAHMCDVQLLGYDDIPVPAHSCVLAAASSFLREAVSQRQSPAATVSIQIPDISSSVIEGVLSFIYTGRLSVAPNAIAELSLAADILNIEKIKQICSLFDEIEDPVKKEKAESSAMSPEESMQSSMIKEEKNENQESYTDIRSQQSPAESEDTSEMPEGSEDTGRAAQLAEGVTLSVADNQEEKYVIMESVKSHWSEGLNGRKPLGIRADRDLETATSSASPRMLNDHSVPETSKTDRKDSERQNLDKQLTAASCDNMTPPGHVEGSSGAFVMAETAKIRNTSDEKLVTVEIQVNHNSQELKRPQRYMQTAYMKVSNSAAGSEETNNDEILQTLLLSRAVMVKGQREGGRKSSQDAPGFECRIKACRKSFDTLPELHEHRKLKHDPADYEFQCHLCGRAFKYKHNIKSHMDRHTERSFACNKCHKTFYAKGDLATHVKTHTGQKPFKCEFCGKQFSQGCNLLKHKRSVHNDIFMGGQRPHECPECLRTFKTQDMLTKHIKRHYQKFTCAICDEAFRLRKDLMEHQKKCHGNEYMPAKEEKLLDVFKCNQCDKNFLDVRKLAVHQETVHDKAKRYACPFPQCNYKAYYRYAIDRHYQRHEKAAERVVVADQELLCDHCREPFSTKKELVKHIREKICREGEVPESQKLYACAGCHARFYSVSALLSHRASKVCEVGDSDAATFIIDSVNDAHKMPSNERVSVNKYNASESLICEETSGQMEQKPNKRQLEDMCSDSVYSDLKKVKTQLLGSNKLINVTAQNMKNFEVGEGLLGDTSDARPKICVVKTDTDTHNVGISSAETGSLEKTNRLGDQSEKKAVQYGCPICGHKSITFEDLRTHIQSHKDCKFEYKCVICKKYFFQKEQAFRHVFTTHGQDQVYPCAAESCEYVAFGSDNLRSHYSEKHAGVDFPEELVQSTLSSLSKNKAQTVVVELNENEKIAPRIQRVQIVKRTNVKHGVLPPAKKIFVVKKSEEAPKTPCVLKG